MATITFDQATLSPGILNRSRSDGLIDGSEVTITVNEPGTVSFVDVPEGDTSAASSLNQASPTVWKFTPTAGIYGSWLVEFRPSAANTLPVRRVFAVRSPKKSLRVPAFNEGTAVGATVANGASFVDASDDNEGENYRGWARSLAEIYRTVDGTSVPLTSNVTVYVDSATGNDSNPGTQAKPFKTIGRAWRERQKYGELRAVFTIQLVGAGTYDWDFNADASVCSGAGRFFLLGDMSAVTVLATGTITGPIAGTAIPTATISGGPYPNDFAEILTGANVGRILQLNDTGANALNVARSAGLAAFVNGDTFRIIRPGTQIRPVDPPGGTTVGGRNGANNWTGLLGDLVPIPLHWIKGVRFITGGGTRLPFGACHVGLTFVRSDLSSVVFSHSIASCVCTTPSLVPGAAGDKLSGCGFVATTFYVYGGFLIGVLSAGSLVQGIGAAPAIIWCYGGRFGPTTFSLISNVTFESGGGPQETVFTCNVQVRGPGSVMRHGSQGTWRWQVATGNCLTLAHGGALTVDAVGVGTLVSGGTTDAAGFGIDVRGGGRVWLRQAPTLTGGTPGNDLRTSGATAPNSALAAVGAVGVPSDALNGEVLARLL